MSPRPKFRISNFALAFAVTFLTPKRALSAGDELHTPHRLASGRVLDIVTNNETGFVGWILKDRGQQQIAFGDLKDIAGDGTKIGFENPLGWDVKVDVVALKFSNGRRIVLYVKDRILKRGPEISVAPGETSTARQEFDFKRLRREKMIRVMSYEDPKNPKLDATYSWSGDAFIKH